MDLKIWNKYTLEYYPNLNQEFLTFMTTWTDEHEQVMTSEINNVEMMYFNVDYKDSNSQIQIHIYK